MEWCDDELFENAAPFRRIVLNFNLKSKEHSPNVDLIWHTGAELNLIKRKIIKTGVPVDSQVRYHLFGINEKGVKTQGEVNLLINGTPCAFQIVPNNFPVNSDGMLGMPFLNNSIIDLQNKVIKHGLGGFPFSHNVKNNILNLKARTRQLVSLKVANPEMKEGYLPLIQTGPGVFLGESLVSVKNDQVRAFCINSTTRDVEIVIPPVQIEEFQIIEPAPRTYKKTSQINKISKEIAIDRLTLKQLNSPIIMRLGLLIHPTIHPFGWYLRRPILKGASAGAW